MEDNQHRDKANILGSTSISILEEEKSKNKSKTKAEFKRVISGNIEEWFINSIIIEHKYYNDLLKIIMKAFSEKQKVLDYKEERNSISEASWFYNIRGTKINDLEKIKDKIIECKNKNKKYFHLVKFQNIKF